MKIHRVIPEEPLYQSPYIYADYGNANSDVTLMYPGFADLVLHFDSP